MRLNETLIRKTKKAGVSKNEMIEDLKIEQTGSSNQLRS